MIPFADAPSHDITIQGLIFPARQIFDEGHVLTEREASTLNQTRDENLRNNYAAKIKVICKESSCETGSELDKDQVTKLRTEFPVFEEAYEFGSRGGAREVDPVRKQAMIFATAEVKKALQKRGHSIKEIGTEKVREMAAAALDKYPKIMEKAAIAVAARDEAASGLEIELG